MSRYEYKTEKTRREKIGFYTAFSICLIAVCMAVYSTYTTVKTPRRSTAASVTATAAVAVAQPVTNVTVPVPTLGLMPITEDTVPAVTEADTRETTQPTTAAQDRSDALQTMLAAEISLTMPTKTGHILQPYSTDSVYNKTLNTWKPHLGADFDGELGEDVLAMLDGEVTKVTEDKMFGKTVEVSVNNVVVGYCGVEGVCVKQGDSVKRGDRLGAIGAVPCEASEQSHIHVYVKINGAYADPLSFVNNDN